MTQGNTKQLTQQDRAADALPLEAQHTPKSTPGPWKVTANPEVNRGDRFRAFEISSSSSDCWLAYVQEHVGPGNGAANARLIASAPSLLEALRDSQDFIRRLHLALKRCSKPVETCKCPEGAQFRANEKAIRDAEGKI